MSLYLLWFLLCINSWRNSALVLLWLSKRHWVHPGRPFRLFAGASVTLYLPNFARHARLTFVLRLSYRSLLLVMKLERVVDVDDSLGSFRARGVQKMRLKFLVPASVSSGDLEWGRFTIWRFLLAGSAFQIWEIAFFKSTIPLLFIL